MGIKVRSKWRLAALVLSLAFLVLTVPAQAALVTPHVVNHTGGGGEPDCKASDVNSTAPNAFWISNPSSASGQWVTDPVTSVQFRLEVAGNKFDFAIRDPGGATTGSWRVADVVVKGSRGTNWYDYDGEVGPVTADTNLGAPQNRSLSHVSFCFGPYYKITGTKFHDRDTDGGRDVDNGQFVEEVLPNWTIRAYSGTTLVGSAVTDANGYYEIIVPNGDFTVCEVLPTTGLAPLFAWNESYPNSTTPNTASCTGTGLAPVGHSVTVSGADVNGVDFGNHKVVKFTACGQTATLNESGKPSASVTLPGNCTTASLNVAIPFDHGITPDDVEGQSIDQFVVFGGSPSGNRVLSQIITWLPYDVDYLDDGTLPIRPTLVILSPGGQPEVGQNCRAGEPSATTVSDCRASRTITETADTADPPGDTGVQDAQIQETETWLFLGDPVRGK